VSRYIYVDINISGRREYLFLGTVYIPIIEAELWLMHDSGLEEQELIEAELWLFLKSK
jgi:hypothetical protein